MNRTISLVLLSTTILVLSLYLASVDVQGLKVVSTSFDKSEYTVGDRPILRVVHPDGNQNPNSIESFSVVVKVLTTQYHAGVIIHTVTIKETGPNTGIFEVTLPAITTQNMKHDASGLDNKYIQATLSGSGASGFAQANLVQSSQTTSSGSPTYQNGFSIQSPSNWPVDDQTFRDGNFLNYARITNAPGTPEAFIQIGKYEDQTPSGSYQQYLEKIFNDQKSQCESASFDNVGFTCSNFSRGPSEYVVDVVTAYGISYTASITMPDGSTNPTAIVLSRITDGNDTWEVLGATLANNPNLKMIEMIGTFKIPSMMGKTLDKLGESDGSTPSTSDQDTSTKTTGEPEFQDGPVVCPSISNYKVKQSETHTTSVEYFTCSYIHSTYDYPVGKLEAVYCADHCSAPEFNQCTGKIEDRSNINKYGGWTTFVFNSASHFITLNVNMPHTDYSESKVAGKSLLQLLESNNVAETCSSSGYDSSKDDSSKTTSNLTYSELIDKAKDLWIVDENYEKAIYYFQEAIDLEPDNYEAYWYLATYHYDRGFEKESIPYFYKLLEVKPDHKGVKFYFERMGLELPTSQSKPSDDKKDPTPNDNNELIEEPAPKKTPQQIEYDSWVKQGTDHLNNGNFDQAIKYFDLAYKQNPSDQNLINLKAEALKKKGMALVDDGKFDLAVIFLGESNYLKPDDFVKALQDNAYNRWYNEIKTETVIIDPNINDHYQLIEPIHYPPLPTVGKVDAADTIHAKKLPLQGTAQSMTKGTPIDVGDVILVGGSSVTLDWGYAQTTLAPNSIFLVGNPEDLQSFARGNPHYLEVIEGQLRLYEHLKQTLPEKPSFLLKVGKNPILVSGTDVTINYDKTTGVSSIQIDEGNVRVFDASSNEIKHVGAGNTLVTNNAGYFFLEQEDPEIIQKPIIKEKVPTWIKNNAKWWAEGQIGDSDFTGGIQHMIKEKIIDIPDLPSPIVEEKIPKPIDDDSDKEVDVPQNLQSYNVGIEVPKLWKDFEGFDQFTYPERTYYSAWAFTWQNMIRLGLVQDAGKTINLENAGEVRNYFEEHQKQWCSDTQENPFHFKEPGGLQGLVTCLEIKDFTFKEVTVDGLEAYQVSYEWRQKWKERDGYTEFTNWIFWGNLIPYGDDLIIVDGETLSKNIGSQKVAILDAINSFEILNDGQPIFDVISSTPLLDSDTSKQDQTPLITDKNLQDEEKIPDWIKNNAGWWADGLISEDDFLNGIKWLVENGIIKG